MNPQLMPDVQRERVNDFLREAEQRRAVQQLGRNKQVRPGVVVLVGAALVWAGERLQGVAALERSVAPAS